MGAPHERHTTTPRSADQIDLTPVTMADLAFGLAGALTAGNVLDVVADTGRRLVHAKTVNISLLDPSRGMLRLVTSRQTSERIRQEFAEHSTSAPLPTNAALTSGRVVLVRDLRQRDRDWPTLRGIEVASSSFAVCPLLYSGRRLGVITFGWAWEQRPDFDPDLVARTEEIARLGATALARTQLFHRESLARSKAERVAERLQTLQDLTMRLASARDAAALGRAVAETAVRRFGAAGAALALVDGEDLVVVAADGGVTPLGPVGRRHRPQAGSPLRTALEGGSTGGAVVDHPGWTALRLRTGDRTLALAALVRGPDAEPVEPEDVAALGILAAHAAVALDRVELLVRSQSTAEVLQRALLPARTPAVPGWEVGIRFVPAVEGIQVGGDWYDLFPLADGQVMIVVGDVMGKGIDAAAVMGSIRTAVRAFAIDHAEPDVVLGEVDRYLARFGGEEIATCVVAALDAPTGRLVHSSAGHPPLLLCAPDGTTTWLDDVPALPLGVAEDSGRSRAVLEIPPGHVVLLYTDGLVEDRRTALADGLAHLASAAPRLCHVRDLTEGVADLVADLTAGHTNADDVAVVALRRAPAG